MGEGRLEGPIEGYHKGVGVREVIGNRGRVGGGDYETVLIVFRQRGTGE